MVKIINGEIVEDHDPRARSLIQAQHQFELMQQQQQLQQQQQHQQQQQQHYYPYPPYGYYPQYYHPPPPSMHQYPPEYQHYYQQQHQSPFATYVDEADLSESATPAAGPSTAPSGSSATTGSLLVPSSPLPSAHHSPSLSQRRLSFSSNPSAAAASAVPSMRRSSFSSLAHPSPLHTLSTPPAPTRRLSLSSPHPTPLSSHSPQPHTLHSATPHHHPPHPSHLTLPPPHPHPHPTSLYPRRHPSHYNLFGLPSITIAEISVRPHVYLLAALLLYFIGPPVLVPLLASFFFYRWHLAKDEAKKERERVELKFSAFRYAKTRPRVMDATVSGSGASGSSGGGARIHSLRDIQGTS